MSYWFANVNYWGRSGRTGVCEVWLLSVQPFMWKTLFHDIFPAHLLKLFDIHKALQTIWKFPGWCYLQNCPKYYLMIKQMSKFLIIISEINLSPFHFLLVSLSTHWSFFLKLSLIIDFNCTSWKECLFSIKLTKNKIITLDRL